MGIFDIMGFALILGLVLFIRKRVKVLKNNSLSVSEMYIKHQEVGFDICDKYYNGEDEPFIIVESGLDEFMERTSLCKKISAFLLLSYSLSYESKDDVIDNINNYEYYDNSIESEEIIKEKIKDSDNDVFNAIDNFYD